MEIHVYMPTFCLACRMALFALQILAMKLNKANAENGNSSFSLVIVVPLCAITNIRKDGSFYTSPITMHSESGA